MRAVRLNAGADTVEGVPKVECLWSPVQDEGRLRGG